MKSEMQLEEQLRDDLRYIAHRQTLRLMNKLTPVVDMPEIAKDCIRQFMEYATKEGARMAMKTTNRKGDSENDKDYQEAIRYNR